MTNKFMTPSRVSKLAGVTPSAVRLWERDGRLSAIRTAGNFRLFREEDVRRFLEERRARRKKKD